MSSSATWMRVRTAIGDVGPLRSPRLSAEGFCLASRVAAILVMLCALAACAGDGGSGTSATPSATASTPASPSDSPTAPESATPSPSATPVLTATATPTATRACDVPGTICTVAGTGKSLFDGDGRDALRTSLYFPYDVTFDRDGRPLILDWNNLRLRRINADNTVETILGTDEEAPPLEGALASETPLHHATDVQLDAAGVMYVAGYHVPLVFGVGTDSRVFLIAGNDEEVGSSGDGGPARAALLDTPFGVFPSPEGGLYLSDIDANVIRYVDPHGIIHAIAGRADQAGYAGDGGAATAALLDAPARLRLDAQGNLVFCDSNNHVLRRVDRDGTITTIAGTGVQGYTGDGGPATLAQLSNPHDLDFGSDGSIYVADTGNNVIRRIDVNGVITTIAGDGEAGYGGDGGDARGCRFDRPTGVAFAPDGSLWVADTLNNRVRRIAGVSAMRKVAGGADDDEEFSPSCSFVSLPRSPVHRSMGLPGRL